MLGSCCFFSPSVRQSALCLISTSVCGSGSNSENDRLVWHHASLVHTLQLLGTVIYHFVLCSH